MCRVSDGLALSHGSCQILWRLLDGVINHGTAGATSRQRPLQDGLVEQERKEGD